MSEKTCITCGATLLPINDSDFYCPYCGGGFAENKKTGTMQKSQTVTRKDCGVDVFEENISSVLEITWSDETYRHSGSGFLIDREGGYALTNTHVVTHENGASCGEVNVRICDTETTATVETLGDRAHGLGGGVDLALIRLKRVPSEAKQVKLGSSEAVRNGERVFVIGNSLGYGTCITSGIVSDKCREVDGDQLLMTDCAINGGNSGGPMFNEKGQVIGVIVSGIDGAEGMNFAIPVDTAKDFCGKTNLVSVKSLATKYSGSYKPANRPCPACNSYDTYDTGKYFWCGACGHEW